MILRRTATRLGLALGAQPDAVLIRVAGSLLVAVIAAAGLAALKGRGLDTASVIGNASAPYLLLPLLAGRLMPRRLHAAAIGVAVTATALSVFYVTASTLYLGTLSLDFSIGRWFLGGTASGTLLGLLGHAARRRRWLLHTVPALLLLEPVIVIAAAGPGFGSGAPLSALLAAGAIEAAAGSAALLLLHRRQRQFRGIR